MQLTLDLDLWAERPAQHARTALVEAHLFLVGRTRQRLLSRIPPRVAVEDLEAEGRLALVRAVDTFDPARGIKFRSYAISRIAWAIKNHLREEDWAPRALRDQQKALARAEDTLMLALHREPTDQERADYLGTDLDGLNALQGRAAAYVEMSLETILRDSEDDLSAPFGKMLLEQVLDPRPGPAEGAEGALLADRLWGAVATLPEREAQLILHHYAEDGGMGEFGAKIDRCGSAVTSLHKSAINGLRARLADLAEAA